MPYYTFAGFEIEMHPQFSLLSSRAEPYRVTTASPTLVIPICGEDAAKEYSEAAVAFYSALMKHDGFFLHASAVEYEGKAYLFSAPSGTGKSTHTRFWCRELGAQYINDDKPAVRVLDGAFYACGTPFSGKHDLSRNVCVPIGGIAALERADENTVERLPHNKALWAILNQTIRPNDAAAYETLLSMLERLIAHVPVYRVRCQNDPSAAHVAKDYMVK